jgi:hypothetical protein
LKIGINKLTFLIFLLLLLLLLVSGCSQTTEEEVAEAVLSANIYLSSRKCDKAISVLEEVGRQTGNASYLKTLASAYACAGGFNELTFFGSDLALIGTPTPFGGPSTFSTRTMTAADDSQYESLQEAINILLYAGGIATTKNPSGDLRATYFNDQDAKDINVQLMYMILAQYGRFLYYYGNTSSVGAKGEGAQGTNTCFFDYDNALTYNAGANTMGDYLDGLEAGGNKCGSAGSGHSDFNPAATKVARLCQGVVLFNNFLDVLPHFIDAFTGSGVDDFSALSTIQTAVNGYSTVLVAAKSGTENVVAVKSQARCESENSATDEYLQFYYAFFYEVLLK